MIYPMFNLNILGCMSHLHDNDDMHRERNFTRVSTCPARDPVIQIPINFVHSYWNLSPAVLKFPELPGQPTFINR